MESQIDETVRVSPFIVVPRNDLVEMFIQTNAGRRIDNGTALVMTKVLRHEGQIGVAQNALHGTFRSLFQGGIHLFKGGWFVNADRQVDHGHIGGGDTDRHARQFAIQFRQDLAHRLGGTGRGGNHIGHGRSSATPILATLGGSIHDQLRGCTGMNGRHEAFDNAKFFVNHLGQGSEAIGGTRGIGQDRFSGILSVIDTHDKHGSILAGSRNNDTLGAALEMSRGLFNGGKDTGRFANCVGTRLTPRNVCQKRETTRIFCV